MKFSVNATIGEKTYLIEDGAESVAEFWQKAAFWDSLPSCAPGGSTDLRIECRNPLDKKSGKRVRYYSIVSPSERKEFKMGVHMDTAGSLFAKGWTDWAGGGRDHDEEESNDQPRDEAPQQAASSPQNDISAHLERQAERIVRDGGVTWENSGYTVRDGKNTYRITKRDGVPACNCARFEQVGRCEHLIALGSFKKQPVKPSQRDELKLLLTEALDTMTQTEIDQAIARMCGGLIAIEDLSAEQVAKVFRSLSQKLEQAKLRKQVGGAV